MRFAVERLPLLPAVCWLNPRTAESTIASTVPALKSNVPAVRLPFALTPELSAMLSVLTRVWLKPRINADGLENAGLKAINAVDGASELPTVIESVKIAFV